MGSTSDAIVKRRKVFYIPGYDPFPPRRYRELYRKEGAAQAEISDYDLVLTGGLDDGRFGWQVAADIDGHTTHTEIEILVWSDIVQESFHDSILLTYLAMLRTAWIYIATGTLWRLMRLRKGPVIAALYPVGVLLAQLACAVFLGGLVWQGVLTVSGGAGQMSGTTAPAALFLLAGGGSVLAGLWLLRWFRNRDGKIFAYYLMHDFAHSASHRGAYPPDILARLDAFSTTISEALHSDVDEVLVIGHSSGAHLAVSVLADLIRSGRGGTSLPPLSFLSLGQVVPMVSFLPQAHQLRGDLHYLSTRDDITWIDVTAPGDGCAFALCDPVGVSGQATPGKRWPLVFSAAFTQSLSVARWRALRWRFFRLHFQYLCAFDLPKDYDYFQITAGPRTLGARYAGRPASASRIEHAVSKHVATVP